MDIIGQKWLFNWNQKQVDTLYMLTTEMEVSAWRTSSAPGDLPALSSRWKGDVVLDTNTSDMSEAQVLLYRNSEDCSRTLRMGAHKSLLDSAYS